MKAEAIDYFYFLKTLADDTVSKIFGISEVGIIAKTEKRLREYFLKKWEVAARKTVRQGFLTGKLTATPKQIRRPIVKILDTWEKDIREILLIEIDYIYRMARIAGHKKVTGKSKGSLQYDTEPFGVLKERRIPIPELKGFSFTLADEKAIKAIQEQQLFWVGEFVDGFSQSIEDVAREVILEVGEDPVRAGIVLKERLREQFDYIQIPEGYIGPAKTYFEGLVANAATVARVQGQLQSFVESGAAAFMIVNPMDERTCPRCSLLDGLKFPIESGIQQMEAEQDADTIDKVKAAHPWFSESKFAEIRSKSTDDALARNFDKAGITLPPFHFRCRCTVDIV